MKKIILLQQITNFGADITHFSRKLKFTCPVSNESLTIFLDKVPERGIVAKYEVQPKEILREYGFATDKVCDAYEFLQIELNPDFNVEPILEQYIVLVKSNEKYLWNFKLRLQDAINAHFGYESNSGDKIGLPKEYDSTKRIVSEPDTFGDCLAYGIGLLI